MKTSEPAQSKDEDREELNVRIWLLAARYGNATVRAWANQALKKPR